MRPLSFVVLVVLTGCGGLPARPLERTGDADAPAELLSEPTEYRPRAPSSALGRAHFTRYGVGDPYGAGIPYPIFRAWMDERPELLGSDFDEMSARFGFIARAGEVPIGFYLTEDPNTGVQFLMNNCQICHAARLRVGNEVRVIEGLGNRRVRIHAYAHAFAQLASDDDLSDAVVSRAANRVAEREGLHWPTAHRSSLVRATMRAVRTRFGARPDDVERLAEGLPGRVATIEGFSLTMGWQRGETIALPEVVGWTRVPDIITARYRETTSFDGITIGSPSVLAVGADFILGVRERWFDEHPHIATSMFLYMRTFERDLPFPGTADQGLATQGYEAFEVRCSRCHGHYARPGEPGRVSYREQIVAAAAIGTDTARLDAVTDRFVEVANAVPITQGLTVSRRTQGWVPRPLLQVWARGHYGHNGQWPDLVSLATPPAERPIRFVVMPNAPMNLERVGQRWRLDDTAVASDEYVYDGRRPGYGVDGHPFLSDAPTQERTAILEYLKTL